METKLEEKIRFFFKNNSRDKKINDFTISIGEFEYLLKNFIEKNQQITPLKNSYKLYGIDNKFFKIYHDGSCYGYTIKEQELVDLGDNLYRNRLSKIQIYNDDFPGLKTYWVEEIYEEIIFKIADYSVIFSKYLDVPRDKDQYSIFIETKGSNLTEIRTVLEGIFTF